MITCECRPLECCDRPIYGYQPTGPRIIVFNPDTSNYWYLEMVGFGNLRTLDWSSPAILDPNLLITRVQDVTDGLWYGLQLRGVGNLQTLDWTPVVAAPASPNGTTDLSFNAVVLTWPMLKLVGAGLQRTLDWSAVLP